MKWKSEVKTKKLECNYYMVEERIWLYQREATKNKERNLFSSHRRVKKILNSQNELSVSTNIICEMYGLEKKL